MKSTCTLDTIHNRLEVCASGQWTMEDADDFHRQMLGVRQWADRNGEATVSILADLDGLVLHTAPIAERVAITVNEIRSIRRSKYALVVPSYLMRMQCRRLLNGIEHQIFDTREQAIEWLGWRMFIPRVAA
ncbi:STAS/SEC14 domain-containing protein [Sphingomonas sp. AOB5]|uniref:STAS/SEC14 domain-containing protein n=1 Tax=Sphingomonas sp. AOB5 TaxID=3034017 RepID=UPI0023F7A568|nr:STAS/SEC14 domain-containing protein [Sphingomonas sp. AOB5]MDF7775018.1 STAS/SEC14 domain-containing protein [Sphingomonas sp. AOB5]